MFANIFWWFRYRISLLCWVLLFAGLVGSLQRSNCKLVVSWPSGAVPYELGPTARQQGRVGKHPPCLGDILQGSLCLLLRCQCCSLHLVEVCLKAGSLGRSKDSVFKRVHPVRWPHMEAVHPLEGRAHCRDHGAAPLDHTSLKSSTGNLSHWASIRTALSAFSLVYSVIRSRCTVERRTYMRVYER
jgi:hypothetical protein